MAARDEAGVTLEAVAEALVLASPTDLPALAELHTRLEAAAAAASGEAVDAWRAAATRVEAMVLGDEPDGASVLASINTLVERAQVGGEVQPPAAAPPAGGEPAPQAAAPAGELQADTELIAGFVSEAEEHLQNAEASLLALEGDPEQPEQVNAVFRAFHTIKGVAGFMGLTAIGELAHEAENLLDRCRQGEQRLAGSVADVVFETVDGLRELVGAVGLAVAAGGTPEQVRQEALIARLKAVASVAPDLRLGELLTESGLAAPEAVDQALARQAASGGTVKLGEALVRQGDAAARDVALALRTQRDAREAEPAPRATVAETVVRVDSERLDRLVDLIGELVIAESMVAGSPELASLNSARLGRDTSRLDKITRELQELATSLRMTPIRPLFQKMTRLARDVAKKAGKQVEIRCVGEDTELDKSVVDLLGDPLVHMVRNAVDHGLEPDAAAREAAGKPKAGAVELRAYHRGGSVFVEVRDDGRGLNREAICAKAIERGLLAAGATPPDREVWQLIFEPGFSTAKAVTDVSGRGVGMDVVRRNIENLRGTIEIESETGAGSLFRIRLPLTLAVIDGMVLRTAGERYILPTLSVVTSCRPRQEDLFTIAGAREMLRLQGELLPLWRLGALFGLPDAEPDATAALAVVVELDGERVALLVDELLGQQQIVIKGLDETLRQVPGLAGAAILPDGRVGLILDVNGLLKLAHSLSDELPQERLEAMAAG